MKSKARLILTSSAMALMAAGQSAFSQEIIVWTGNSAHYVSCSGTPCPDNASNSWNEQGDGYTNWYDGDATTVGDIPTVNHNVYIGRAVPRSDGLPAYDTVVIHDGGSSTYDAVANTIIIGAPATTLIDAGGEGHLTNNGDLHVQNGMTIGSVWSGTFINNDRTTIENGGIRVGSSLVAGTVTNGENGAVEIKNGPVFVENGTFINSGQLTVEDGNIEVGTSFTQAHFVNNGMIDVGMDNGDGDVKVRHGTFDNTDGVLNIWDGSLIIGLDGDGTFTNGNGTVNVSRNLKVGDEDDGTLTSDGGIIQVGGETVLGEDTGSHGSVELSNGARLETDGNLIVGESGTGALRIGQDSLVDTDGIVVIGQDSSSTDNEVLVEGEMRNGRNLTIGQYGSGMLEVGPSGIMETDGRVTLGLGVTGAGMLRNSGGQVTNNNDLIVGGDGLGIVITDGPDAVTTTDRDTIIGDEESGSGLVIVREGVMTSGRSVVVGDEGEGYLSVEDGGRLTSNAGVIGNDEDARGYALVTDSGVWENATSLTLGNRKDSGGLLVINDDATVRIGDGEGTLTIAAEEGSVGILNIGAYAPKGDDYGIRIEVRDMLPDDLEVARGAGHLDADFVEFGSGQGLVNFKHTETETDDYRFKAGFVGKGTVLHHEGFTVLDGDSSGFTGAMGVLGGTVVVNNELAGDVAVASGATLRIGHGGETGDVVNDIYSEGQVQFNRSDTYVFDSVISGTGAVEQMGSGTTVITAANTYSGETSITNGTLQLGDGGASGSIAYTSGVEVGDDGTLAFNRSDAILFDRQISGTGRITHIGTGLTSLSAENSGFTGETLVQSGILSVNNVLGGTMEVVANSSGYGVLEGTGQVGSTVVREGGFIAPGNILGEKIGELTVAGDLSNEAGSYYLADVLSTGENDLLRVTDEAEISDGAILHVSKLDDARYELEHRYTVLTAEQGLTGDFALQGDTWVSTFYRVEDNYDANNAYLDVAQHRLFQEAGLTANQLAAATAAQELKAERDAQTGYPTNELFRAIAYLQTDSEAQRAFDLISGEIHASVKSDLVESSKFVRDAVTHRIRNAFGVEGAAPQKLLAYGQEKRQDGKWPVEMTPEQNDGLAIWTQAFGSWGSIDGDGNAADLDRDIGGFFVGADMPINDTFRVGILGGYSHSSYDAKGRNSTGSSDNFDLGVYGGGQWDGLGLRLGANYSWHRLSFDRSVMFPGFSESISSEYDAHTIQAFGDIGYTFDVGGASFEPFAALAYVRVKTDDYAETGGVAALSGAGSETDTGFSTLGLRVASNVGENIKARGMVGWRHAFSDIESTTSHHFAGYSDFTVGGVPVAKNLAVVEAGLDAALSETVTFGVSYAGQFGDGVQEHGLRGVLDWKF